MLKLPKYLTNACHIFHFFSGARGSDYWLDSFPTRMMRSMKGKKIARFITLFAGLQGQLIHNVKEGDEAVGDWKIRPKSGLLAILRAKTRML